MKNLWSGRFTKGMTSYVAEYNASINFDCIMYEYDIEGSIAHVTMLAKQNIISESEKDEIIRGLLIVKDRIKNGEVEFSVDDEDIHMTVEKLLFEEVGTVGKKLHTARSRNDQNDLDEKLYLRHETKQTLALLKDLLEVLLKKAEAGIYDIIPGFTHTQHAQPITVGFYYMCYFQKFKRDVERFLSSYERLDYNPLGACALAGTTLPIDRAETTKLMGFAHITENALDTVSDRDYIVEYLFCASMCMTHLSRFADEYVMYNSQEFGFIDIDDSFCTGSSIMPQKKNPDIAELVRGKVGRVVGHLMGLLMVLKGTPMSFNKDFQEDKEPLFDAVNTINQTLFIFARMLENTTFKMENIKKQLEKGFINATDIAEFLVCNNIPFRDAHEMVGSMVKYCEQQNKTFADLTHDDLKTLHFPVEIDSLDIFTNEKCVAQRKSYGGTSPEDVKRQIQNGYDFIASL